MVFSSLFFLYLFLPLCVICYAATKKNRYRNAVLIIFSLIFYAWGEPLCVFILIISAALNYILAFAIDKYRGKLMGKLAVFFAVFFDLAVLGIFKYSGFIAENLNALLPLNLPVPDIKLPIGISFYTFQIISYVIDCHWEKVSVQKSFPKFLMYVSLFPQLVAGPIVRYSTIESEINNRRTTLDDLSSGVSRIAVGLAKKVILANNLSIIVEAFFGSDIKNLSVTGTWYAVIIYAMQIYFDFSGYSDMAIGLGRIFGFHFDENFNYPFICKDVSEFWQRWHISLSTFFRDYLLYVPIFGKRRKYGGLFLVWFCTGLWHGASWNFVCWGLLFFVLLTIEKLGLKNILDKYPALGHLYIIFIIPMSWMIFALDKMGDIKLYFAKLFPMISHVSTEFVNKLDYVDAIKHYGIFFVFAVIFSLSIPMKIFEKYRRTKVASVILIIIFWVCVYRMSTAASNPFLYFRF